MGGIEVTESLMCSELRQRLGIDDIITAVQRNWLRWYAHVLRKDENDWVKKCIDYEAKGIRRRGRPRKTCSEVTEKDCHTQQRCEKVAVDHSKCRKLVKDVV